MATKKQGVWPANTEPSWTDESLPLAQRRKLLDHALDQIKASKGRRGHPDSQNSQNSADHPGESGSGSPDHND